MGLLDRRKSPLARLASRDWSNDDDRKAIFRQVAAKKDLKLKEMIWMLTAPEAEIRQLGVMLLQRFSGPSLANALLDELKDKNPAQQRLLIRHMARCDPQDVQNIATRLLSDPDRRRRAMGVELVNALPVEGARTLVMELLRDPSAEARVTGLTKLLEDPNVFKDPNLKSTILGMAKDSDEQIRLAVIRTVLNAPDRDEEMEKIIVAGMRDESYNIQQLAAEYLASRIKQGDEQLETQLIELLSDGSTSVRTAVIKALLQSPDRNRVIRNYLSYARTLAGWVRDRALESLKAFSNDLIEPVIELMNDEDEEIRLLALGVGGNFEDKRCVEPICTLLQTGDWWTKVTAAETLGRIGDPRAVPYLVEALKSEDARWTALESLGKLKDPSSIPAILAYLEDPAAEIRVAAAETLAVFEPDDRIVQAIEKLAREDQSRSVRDRALELVRKLEEKRGSTRRLDELEAAARRTSALGEVNELEQLLIDIRNKEGSDLHLSVGVPPMGRIYGELQRMTEEELSAERIEQLVRMILTDRQIKLLEENLQLDFCYNIPNVGRYRTNVFIQRLGWGAVFRVIPGTVPTFQDINMPSHMTDLVNYHQGLIVVAGPSGSGKSTTLAALVNLFNENKRAHVLTIEDPVEFVHPMKNCLINQREVGKHTQSFANALKGALREDPDVIMVGEMRDNETMKMAMEAAETGHLVIATLNTTTAPKTVDRHIESFPPAEQGQVRAALSESLKAVICQNLMPRADGKGRVGLFEILMGTSTSRNMIRDNKTYQLLSAMQIGKNQGMRTVDMSLMELMKRKLITPEAAYLRAKDKENFEPYVSETFLREALGDFDLDEGPADNAKAS